MANKNIIIVAGPVIIENNKILLVKHGQDKDWKFPGGKLQIKTITDWNNSLEQTAIREAKEELGIDIEIIKALKPMFYKKPGIDNKYVVLIHFLANRIGSIKAGNDINKWDWFDIKNLPTDCAKNVKIVIKNYLTNYKHQS